MRGFGKPLPAALPAFLALAPLAPLALLPLLAACSQDAGESLPYTPQRFLAETAEKYPPKGTAVFKAAACVDTSDPERAKQALAGAAGYRLKTDPLPDGGTGRNTDNLYFDMVTLGWAEIVQGERVAVLHYPDTLLAVLRDWAAVIKPLRDRGVKVLLGIKGGHGGVAIGSLLDSEQPAFARDCADALKFYGLDGIEFYDVDGESMERSPYPLNGAVYWNGEGIIDLSAGTQETAGKAYDAWVTGGGRTVNMLSYIMESVGASATFQGDFGTATVDSHPVLVRETGYGRYIPNNVPRYAFQGSMSCLSYFINPYPEVFGGAKGYDGAGEAPAYGSDGKPLDWDLTDGDSVTGWVDRRAYAPVLIDLASAQASDERLLAFSRRLGKSGAGQDFKTDYGLVYYDNLAPPSASQTAVLSVTSLEVFGEEVEYRE